MANGNELEEHLEVEGPRREAWMQRHGAGVLLAIFGLVLAGAIVYEQLTR